MSVVNFLTEINGLDIPWRKGPLRDPRRILLVGTVESKTIGMISGMTDGEVTYLTDLYVAPEWRGRGHGTKLMQQFLREAAGTTIVLLTMEAQGFYEKFGFVQRVAMVKKGQP